MGNNFFPPAPGGGGAGGRVFASEYKANTTITAPPANGQVRWNNATQSSAAKLFVSYTTEDGKNIDDIIKNLFEIGDSIVIADRSDIGQRQIWLITGLTDQTTYMEYDVTFVDSEGVDFSNNQKIVVVWDAASSSAVTSVFARVGAVIAAASDYDASQVDNDSGVAGAFVDDALDTLETAGDLNTTHRGSDGKNHSDVVLNNTHRASDGTDHSDVGLNNTHRASDGKDHSDVVLNNTHRASDGTDHGFIDQSVVSGAAPTFNGLNISGIVTGDVDQVHIAARKGTAGTILQNRPVYITGYNASGFVLLEEADNSDPAKMPAIGTTEIDLTNSTTEFVALDGRVTGLDTSAWAEGAVLYVAAAGVLTTTKPTGTALIQKIAEVARSHASMGVIIVFGAGRTNDLPNIPSNNFWLGNGSGVPVETDFDVEVSANSDVAANVAHAADTVNPHATDIENLGGGTLAELNAAVSDATLDDSSDSRTDDNAIHDNVDAEINAITSKATPVSGDLLLIEDSAASNAKKKITIGDLPNGAILDFPIDIPAGAWEYGSSNPAPLIPRILTNIDIPEHLFGIGDILYRTIRMPPGLDSSGIVTIVITGMAVAAVASKNVKFQLGYSKSGNGEDVDVVYSTKDSGDKAVNDNQDFNTTFSFTETVANLGVDENDQIRIYIKRIAASANELAGDFGLTYFRANAPRA